MKLKPINTMTTETYKNAEIRVVQHKDGSHTVDVPSLKMEWQGENLGITLTMIKSLIDKINEK